MRTIWKFLVPIGLNALEASGPRHIPGPIGCRHVGMDPATLEPAVWWEVDTEQPPAYRRLVALGTGAEIPPGFLPLGTAICGPHVWHVFERLP